MVAEGAGQGAVVTVAHEALLRAWPRLAERLKSEAELLRIRSRLRSDAARWQAQGREQSLLLASGKPLEEARLLAPAFRPDARWSPTSCAPPNSALGASRGSSGPP